MTYPMMNGTAVGSDLSQILVYANTITDGWAVFCILLSFFLVVLLGGMFSQMRITGRVRFEVMLAAASFATLGFAAILSTVNGLIAPIYFFITIALAILSVIWIMLSSE